MKKAEILSGRKLFKQVAMTGKRVEAGMLRCRYLQVDCFSGQKSRVLVGFKVSHSKLNAVRRNRFKRLMREAMRLEYKQFEADLPHNIPCIAMVLTARVRDASEIRHISLTKVREDVRTISRIIASEGGEDQ